MTFLEFLIVEHFDEGAPEPFGSYLHPIPHDYPSIGETIQLRWLDGSAAYKAKIFRIEGNTLHVHGYPP